MGRPEEAEREKAALPQALPRPLTTLPPRRGACLILEIVALRRERGVRIRRRIGEQQPGAACRSPGRRRRPLLHAEREEDAVGRLQRVRMARDGGRGDVDGAEPIGAEEDAGAGDDAGVDRSPVEEVGIAAGPLAEPGGRRCAARRPSARPASPPGRRRGGSGSPPSRFGIAPPHPCSRWRRSARGRRSRRPAASAAGRPRSPRVRDDPGAGRSGRGVRSGLAFLSERRTIAAISESLRSTSRGRFPRGRRRPCPDPRRRAPSGSRSRVERPDLMLREESSRRSGRRVPHLPRRTIDDGIEILTGHAAGDRGKAGAFPREASTGSSSGGFPRWRRSCAASDRNARPDLTPRPDRPAPGSSRTRGERGRPAADAAGLRERRPLALRRHLLQGWGGAIPKREGGDPEPPRRRPGGDAGLAEAGVPRSGAAWFRERPRRDPDFLDGRSVDTRVVAGACVFLRADRLCAVHVASASVAGHPYALKPALLRPLPSLRGEGGRRRLPGSYTRRPGCCSPIRSGSRTPLSLLRATISRIRQAPRRGGRVVRDAESLSRAPSRARPPPASHLLVEDSRGTGEARRRRRRRRRPAEPAERLLEAPLHREQAPRLAQGEDVSGIDLGGALQLGEASSCRPASVRRLPRKACELPDFVSMASASRAWRSPRRSFQPARARRPRGS